MPRTFVDGDGLPLGLWVHVVQTRVAKGALSDSEREAYVAAAGISDLREQQFIDGLIHIKAHAGAKATIGARHVCDDGFPLSGFIDAFSDSLSVDTDRRKSIVKEVLGVTRLSEHRFFRAGGAGLKANSTEQSPPTAEAAPSQEPFRLDGISDAQYLNLYQSWRDRHPDRVEVPIDDRFVGFRLGKWFSTLTPKRGNERARQLRSMVSAIAPSVRFLSRTSVEETRVRQTVKMLRAFAVAGSPKPEVVRHIVASALMTTPLSAQDETDIDQAGYTLLVNHLRTQGAFAA
ncbi:hypothetical protein GCM10009689_18370 [Brevibacterium antiquum]